MKSYGTMEGVYINGAPQGITFHETDNFTLYPASILSVNKNRFTKHYFLGDKRVASRIGTGLFNNVYGRNGSYVTAGQQDYAERMNQIQRQKEAYYKQQGIAKGAGVDIATVNRFIKQFEQTQKMMKQFGGGKKGRGGMGGMFGGGKFPGMGGRFF